MLALPYGDIIDVAAIYYSYYYYSLTLKKWGYTGFGLSVIP